MNFYLDFEATQFSHRIISIGCVTDNGATFYSLVALPKGEKVNQFITDLTGITNEMLATAPTADEVFYNFQQFVNIYSENENNFYSYGNEDVHFIDRTIHKMENKDSIEFAKSLIKCLKDYFPCAQSHFQKCDCPNLSLKSIFAYCLGDKAVKWHDALEDARMLQYVINHVNMKDPTIINQAKVQVIKEKSKNKNKPVQYTKKKIGVPQYFDTTWNIGHKNMWKAETFANENNYRVKAIHLKTNNIMYFDCMETAILWLIKFNFVANIKASRLDHRQKIVNRINANRKDKYGFSWEIR